MSNASHSAADMPSRPTGGESDVDEVAPDGAPSADAVSVVGNLRAPTPTKVSLKPGRELGLDGLALLAARRPVRLIGLLGQPAAGKTMALVSMFLLAADGKLEGYEYRNSETAFAFDDLSRGARAWATHGGMLDQIVPHTELTDERRPGFLHLRLHAKTIGYSVDLAFPDLPGEWTETLSDRNNYERLSFLRNADAIWIFVDGQKLANLEFGHDICGRTRTLIGRLAAHLSAPIPIKLVVTRADQYETIPPAVLDPIREEAEAGGLNLEVHEIISVDRAMLGRSGEGISRLLDASVSVREFKAAPELSITQSPRQMLRYRSEEAV